MKQELDENSREALINYRLQRAKGTLREADILLEQHCYNAVVNRLYYACYYAVLALLLRYNVEAHTHQGVKQMFGLHFIATGKMENKYSRFYSQLFNDRISGDYDDFLSFDEIQIAKMRFLAEDFINCVARLLE